MFIDTVHIGSIYLVIQIQNKAEVEMFFCIQVSFRPQNITVECKLWCQSSYHMYVVMLPLFVRSLHVAAFLWA